MTGAGPAGTGRAAAGSAGTVLVIQNEPESHLGRVGDWLRDAGVTLEVVRADCGDTVPQTLGPRALMVLGGWMHPADDDAHAAWLPATRALTTAAVEQGNPMLGICLGGQLLAHTAGGQVMKHHGTPEYGPTPITLLPDAPSDPLFGGLPADLAAIEHHRDTITELPPDAVWLARSASCPYQAFRVGTAAWGVQFHPEIDPDRILSWDEGPLHEAGTGVARLHAEARREDPAMRSAWRDFTQRFAQIVHEWAQSRSRTEGE